MLVDDRSGVTFRAELCIPWEAPEAVVDIDSVLPAYSAETATVEPPHWGCPDLPAADVSASIPPKEASIFRQDKPPPPPDNVAG